MDSVIATTTLLGEPAVARLRRDAVPELCEPGMILRALALVLVIVAAGTAFGSPSWTIWFLRLALAAAVAVPATLAWLVAACSATRLLGRVPKPLRVACVSVAGGLAAWGACLPLRAIGLDAGDTSNVLAIVGAGTLTGAVIYHWLDLRVRATLPAATEAGLIELQSRVQPHFLFNTLNTALALVRLDPARAEGVLEDLAELFRVAISDSREAVTLAEEVELAQRYLAIEQIRFGSRLNVSWDLDPAAGVARVPPLLLQPLVENAVRHGVEPGGAGGTIRVRTRVRLGRAEVSIVNSVPPEPSRPGSGMAIRNVRERLRLMHDVAAQFDARREHDVFRVQIVVPL